MSLTRAEIEEAGGIRLTPEQAAFFKFPANRVVYSYEDRFFGIPTEESL